MILLYRTMLYTRQDNVDSLAIDQALREVVEKELQDVSSSMVVDLMMLSINMQSKQDLDRQSLSNLKLELERKHEEQENLISTLQRNRVDLLRKQEDTRNEYDEKIELLLRQLRAAEERVNNLLANNVPLMRPDTAEGAGRYRSSSRPSTATLYQTENSRISRSAERSIPERQLMTTSQSDQHQHIDENSSEGHVSMQIHQEVIRRWQAEKDRRVLLESRTAEMSKELRLLKSKTIANGVE